MGGDDHFLYQKEGKTVMRASPSPQSLRRVTLADLGQANQVAVSLPSPQAGCGAGWWSWLREEDFVSGMTNE